MAAQVISIETFRVERIHPQIKALSQYWVCEIIKVLEKPNQEIRINQFLIRSLNSLNLGSHPLKTFVDVLTAENHLQTRMKILRHLLEGIDLSKTFRFARVRYPHEIQLINLIERNFEAFSLEASRAFLVERDEMCVQGATKKHSRVENPTPFLYPKRTILRRVFFSLWGKIKELPFLFINFHPTKRSRTMKHVSKNKGTNLKEHFSKHKKLYGGAALMLVAGTVFSESVQAAADVPADFEGGYEIGVNWFKKGSRLAIAGAVSIGLVTAITAGNILRAGLFAILGFGGISFLKFIWTQLETMFG